MKKLLLLLIVGCIIFIGSSFIAHAQYGYQDSSYRCYSTQCADCVPCTSSCIDGSDCTVGGGGTCSSDTDCLGSTPYCDELGTQQCVAAENLTCEPAYANCPSGYTCATNHRCTSSTTSGSISCTTDSQCISGFCDQSFGACYCFSSSQCPSGSSCSTSINICQASGTSGGNNIYCHVLDNNNHLNFSYRYDTEADCRINCQTQDCEYYWKGDCKSSCCLSADMDGQNVTCSNAAIGGGSATIPNPLRCGDIQCLVQAIADWITGLVVVIGGIMIIISGIQFIVSAGNEEKARRARQTIIYTLIGIAIAFCADFIVGFLGEILGKR